MAAITTQKNKLLSAEIIFAVGIISIISIMLLPIPAFMLDILIAININLTIVILFVSLYTVEPLDFSTFPSLLLITTLFRLALNIASTRLILLGGNTGDEAAGKIIRSFGTTIVGGDYVVGFIVFLILVLINFIVITKGAGRIAEVAARFALDAMPGKQMAIDADLNAGVINDIAAQERRSKIQRESDFFGAMDGASKFVRGDAIASLIITGINIIGGLIIGTIVHGLPIARAASQYTILTIGDGLVTQIPALIISTAAGITVSKAGRKNRLGFDLGVQLFGNYKILLIAGCAVFLFMFIPSTPKVPFIFLGALFFTLAWRLLKAEQKRKQLLADEELGEKADKVDDISGLLPLDTLGLELGYGLIPLVDNEQDGELLERIKAIRRQIALDYGFVVPSVHIKDNLDLAAGQYLVAIKGVEVGRCEMKLNNLMAMKVGQVDDEIEGEKTIEPAFGLPATWINPEDKDKAQISGYTVVDIPTVITTHLTEIIKLNAHEFLQRQDVQNLLNQTSVNQPKLIEELVPTILPVGTIHRVLQGLLKEGVSIRDMSTILETLTDYGTHTKSADVLIEFVRQSLVKSITKQYQSNEGSLQVMVLDAKIEKLLADNIQDTAQGAYLSIPADQAQAILEAIEQSISKFNELNAQPIIVTTPKIRPQLKKLTERVIPNLVVLSHNEISYEARLDNLGSINITEKTLETESVADL